VAAADKDQIAVIQADLTTNRNGPFILINILVALIIIQDFFNIALKEAVHGERFLTRSEAKYQVFDYIEVYYNRKRLHSKLGYVSSEAFEAKKVA
jgi:transposase InsO family protein